MNEFIDMAQQFSSASRIVDTITQMPLSSMNREMPTPTYFSFKGSRTERNNDLEYLNHMMLNGTKTSHHMSSSMMARKMMQSLTRR